MNVRAFFSRLAGPSRTKTTCSAVHDTDTRRTMSHDAEEIALRGSKHGGTYRGRKVRWESSNGVLVASTMKEGRPYPVIVWPEGFENGDEG